MQGCHNCKYKINPSEKFEDSPCRSCHTAKDPSRSAQVNLDGVIYSEEYAQIHPAYRIPETERDKLVKALSCCMLKLLKLKEKEPYTFNVTMTKIQHPEMSYAEIAQVHNCKKQNIQYHLEKAVSLCNELKYAILIDQRFN